MIRNWTNNEMLFDTGGIDDNTCSQLPSTSHLSLIAYPCLLVVCSLGNALNVVVLLRLEKKLQLKEALLLALSLSDIVVMWFCLPLYLELHACHLLRALTQPTDSFDHGIICFRWLHYSFCYISDGILVLFSCERLMAFRWIHTHRLVRNRRRLAVFGILVVSVIAVLITLEWVVGPYYVTGLERIHLAAAENSTRTFEIPTWLLEWQEVQQAFDIAFPIAILCVTLAVNLWLLCYLRKSLRFSVRFRSRSLRSAGSLTNGNSSEGSSGINMYVLLLGCSSLYFITQSPAVVINTIAYLCSSDKQLLDPSGTLALLRPVAWTLSKLNYSVNFLVYAGLSRRYRTLSRDTLCGGYTSLQRSSGRGELADIPLTTPLTKIRNFSDD
ncbi:hypothetical protein BV898_00231 [Hypsibius exemplaris]|uniref:G-protein coupled receptors family 1 profile domain-containing protein n=1 Tax=Hypsibius exemplaris TaxID=2072580 RepID=A0A1W0XF54_HYPEX|nr:hypothetical protein BV898_00231 [Hypsibius exemplaris]